MKFRSKVSNLAEKILTIFKKRKMLLKLVQQQNNIDGTCPLTGSCPFQNA